MTARGFLASVALVVSCAIPGACQVGGTEPRFGFGAGASFSTGTIDQENLMVPDTEFESDGASFAAFAEALFPGVDADAHFRLLAADQTQDVVGFASGEAEVRQVFAFGLLSRELSLFEPCALRPFFGLGIGHVDVDLDPLLALGDPEGIAGAITIGVELEVAGHASIGAMNWFAFFGEPGDTFGDTSNLLVYAGFRF